MNLSDRMKKYEFASDFVLTARLPIIVRVDGKGFHKWVKTAKLERPFDMRLVNTMSDTMNAVQCNVEGAITAYTQSDEISFLLRNDQSEKSEPWFSNRVQKICSVIASMTTAYFAKYSMQHGIEANFPFFDARVFVVPNMIEALNYFVWRQQDAVKNSITSACYFEVSKKLGKKITQKLMQGLKLSQRQELLFKETGINWNNYDPALKRGFGVFGFDLFNPQQRKEFYEKINLYLK